MQVVLKNRRSGIDFLFKEKGTSDFNFMSFDAVEETLTICR